MAAQGTAIVNFGAFPGKSDASVDITGQGGILAGSLVEAWIRPVDSADHSADEHILEQMKVVAGNITPGVGFTIYAISTAEKSADDPLNIGRVAFSSAPVGPSPPDKTESGLIPMIYGQWNVNWVWN